jgi:hypothetical protein
MFSGSRASFWFGPKGPVAANAAVHHHAFVIICLLTIFALFAIVQPRFTIRTVKKTESIKKENDNAL